jgi:hypothetical protein
MIGCGLVPRGCIGALVAPAAAAGLDLGVGKVDVAWAERAG